MQHVVERVQLLLARHAHHTGRVIIQSGPLQAVELGAEPFESHDDCRSHK
jgi:hypothetical protein